MTTQTQRLAMQCSPQWVIRRTVITKFRPLSLPSGAISLVYVAEGAISGHPSLPQDRTFDADPVAATLAITPSAHRDVLVRGDALLTMGGKDAASTATDPLYRARVLRAVVSTARVAGRRS